MRILFLFLISFSLVNCVSQIPQVSQILISENKQPSSDEEEEVAADEYELSGSDRGVDRYGNEYEVDEYDRYEEDRGRGRRSCRNYTDEDSDFTIEELDYIDAHNLSEYLLEGRCESGEEIEITINGYPIDQKVYCKSKRWELTVDLTPLAQEEVISFEISSYGERFCEDVKVAFTSPKNYIAVPGLEGYYETGFLVMKYEAKLHKAGINSKAVSEAKGRPIFSISHSDAQKLCRNNGSRYDLISNNQWQNIARDIESIDENWSLGKAKVIEGNILNCGVNRGAIREASRSDDDDCGTSSCNRNWDYNRRTHLLSSGERIWDICGNVGEIMKDKHTGTGGSSRKYIYDITGKLKDLFGPDKRYNIIGINRRQDYFGLGHINIDKSKKLIVRGSQDRYAGVFSTEITRDRDSSRSGYSVGFRCVYLP